MVPNNTQIILLLLAAFLDYLIGDPWGWPHPVQLMGFLIAFFSQLILNLTKDKITLRLGGIVLGTSVIIVSGLTTWLLIKFVYDLQFYLGLLLEVILLASCLAAHSLRQAAMEVIEPLSKGEIDLARSNLSKYVGRDTENLSEEEIYRAVLETVTENAVDGVTAPLFYAIVGSLIPGVGAVPLAIAYKAASTLDSMIGYLKEPYTHIGWFSAQLEDRLTWLPCRLTVLTLSLISRKPLQVWAICHRDAVKDPSPNSGWSEGVYAAILGVQLGGANSYGGVVKHKPLLGDPFHPITADKIIQALALTRLCVLLWLLIAIPLISTQIKINLSVY